MNKYILHNVWKIRLFLGFIASSFIITLANSVSAQIVPDNTLGRENSIVNPNGNVRGLPATLLEGGAIRGVNLFQSFSKFNVGDGERVYFNNPAGIQNILSRITGSDPSKIFGTLGVDGNANLFFLNPNGILFGPNARLDVAGSFFASTANSFVFENGLQFSATNPEAAPLITVNIRPGLQFGGNQSGTISSTANLSAGQDLTLAGVNLDLQGKLEAGRDLTLQATDTVKIRDSVVNPFIASAGGKLVLQGNQNVDIFALNNPNSGFFSGGDMVLRSANTVGGDAHYWAGGNFQIQQLDGNLGNLFSPYDPVIRASGDVSFDSYTGASLHILAGGSVSIGTVDITGVDETNGLSQKVTLSDGTTLQIDGAAQPTLDIRAGTTDFGTPGLSSNPIPGLTGTPNINAPATSANIKIGSINNANTNAQGDPIKGLIILTNQYRANGLTGNIETGNINTYGDVIVDSRGQIKTTGTIDVSLAIDPNNKINLFAVGNITTSKLLSDLEAGYRGNGGQISLFSKNGTIDTTAGDIISRTTDGVAGNIRIEARGDIRLGNINASSNNNGSGYSTIIIQSNQGSVFLDNSNLSTSNSGSADAGDISITANEQIALLNQSKISSNGFAGRIFITSNNNSISASDSSISTTSNDQQTNPDLFSKIIINAKNGNITLNTSQINSTNSNTGFAGDISLTALEKVSILNNSSVDSQGNNGRIFIGASNGVENANYTSLSPKKVIINNSKLSTDNIASSQENTNGKINAGEISIRAIEQISLNNNSRLDTQTSRTGNAGNVSLETNRGNISLANTIIFSNVKSGVTGNAGDVSIKTNGGAVSLDGKDGTTQIQVQTQGTGNAGNVSIATNGGTVSLDNGAIIFSSVEPGGTGNGGEINITAGSLVLKNGAQLQTLVRRADPKKNLPAGNGIAGNITIKVTDKLELDGARTLISSELQQGTVKGQGGNINIDPDLVTITNGARITVDSQGTGNAGTVTLNANRLILNGGQITGNTKSTEGGNITLNLRDLLLMRNGSSISTNAGQNGSPGNGGDITITSLDNSRPFPFIVAVAGENSDITANAFRGKGGVININTSGIFGFVLTPSPQLSEITAISQTNPSLNGIVTINSPEVDLSNNLVSLPENPVDASKLIAQGCGNFVAKRSEFINAGRGGLPPRPDNFTSNDALWNDTRLTVIPTNQNIPNASTVSSDKSALAPIIPATGWVFNGKGDVTLVSHNSVGNSSLLSSNSSSCQIPSPVSVAK